MKKLSLILSIFLSAFYYSQITHNVHLTGTDFPYERIDNEWFTAKIRDKYAAQNESKEIIDAYISYLLESKEYYFKSDLEYTDWKEADDYLQKIFNELYKNENIKPGDVKIKLVRDPEINASAQEDGTIYINVGMLALFNSEAQIASVFGHEWGHVTLGHNFKNFKSHIHYMRSASLGNGFGMLGFGLTGLVVRKVSENELEGALISGEIEADNNAVLSSQRSMYSNLAGVEVENYFFAAEEKERSKVGYEKMRNYIATHPSTKKRIGFFKKAIANDSASKKNFIVDSAYFVKLKQQAIDETIYLFFKKQEFNDCIELCFTQYLHHPKDNYYLFFLVESIRRLIAVNNAMADKNFITANYVLKPKKVTRPIAITSGKYKINTIGEFVYQNSIFFHLKNLLFIDSVALLKNKQLTDTDTLEFITYNDALQFFKNEAKANNCFTCEFSENLKTPLVKTKMPEQNNIEKYYNDLVEIYTKYLANKYLQEPKNLIILEGFNQYSAFNSGTGGSDSEKKFRQNFESYGNDFFPDKYETESVLNMKEYNSVFNYYYTVNKSLPRSTANAPYIGVTNRFYDCKSVFPEITETLHQHNINKVFYVHAVNYDYGTYSNDYCEVTMIDLKNSKIAKSGVKLGALSSVSLNEKIYELINELGKNK